MNTFLFQINYLRSVCGILEFTQTHNITDKKCCLNYSQKTQSFHLSSITVDDEKPLNISKKDGSKQQ